MTTPPTSGAVPKSGSFTGDAARLAAALAERYRLERDLGAGGMATVYLAEDLKQHRQVAIKVLHAELSAVLGPERFLKEIELTASLQHPHILPLFDSGSAEGLLYYVMPYVDGEALRGRLARETQLPVSDAVRIATEVASALDYVHRRGVVHRDIKPENILLHDGTALVADFGIALAVQQAGRERMTQTDLSLGTPQYMSPEQAMGERDIGPRSDIYSLGAVIYEMLAGEPPFSGPTAQAIVAKVMTEEPKGLTAQRRSVPPHVDDAVSTALEKLPADRFASAREFADALAARGVTTRATHRVASNAPGRRVALLSALLAAAVLTAASGWIAWYRSVRSSTPELPPSRLALLVPTLGGSGTGGLNRQLTLTPDGSSVLFVGGLLPNEAGGRLRRQTLDQESATPIPGTNLVGYAPSVSPDGRWIASRDPEEDVMLLPAIGTLQSVHPLAEGFAFYAWHPDGSLWITRTPYRTVERVLPGSDSLQVMLGPLGQGVWLQQILDDGKTAIVIEQGAGVASGPCALLDLKSGKLTTLVATPIVAARYTAGYLVWTAPDGRDVWLLDLAQKTLACITFDHDGHDATWMPDGRAITYSTNRSGPLGIYRVRPGTIAPAESLLASPKLNFTGEWLPDASGLLTVAIDLRPGSSQDVAIVRHAGRGPIEPLVATPFREEYPAVSHDGRWVAFVSDQSGRDDSHFQGDVAPAALPRRRLSPYDASRELRRVAGRQDVRDGARESDEPDRGLAEPFGTGRASAGARRTERAVSAGSTEKLGTALADGYRLDRELGQGGMATVYLAEDLKHHRQVAIKVLKPERAAVLSAERFVQEIATTAQLQHPNILHLFDSSSAEAFLYYVMPFVEGETLRAKLDRERHLGVAEAVKLTSEVTDALQLTR